MKKIIYTSLLFASVLSLTSCNDLDLTPPDHYTTGTFWKSEAEINAAIEGAHLQFRNHAFDYWTLGEARGGTQKVGASSMAQNIYSPDIKNQNFSESIPNDNNIAWFNFYGRIFNLNDAIENIKKADYISEQNRNYYLGQVYGFRAWYYFLLYRTYGGVPIVQEARLLKEVPQEPSALYVKRSSPKQTLDFIKGDINASQKHFEDSGRQTTLVRSHWSYYASLMLKAEIYLWSAKVTTGDQTPDSADLDTAKQALDMITASGKFRLLDSYADVFDHSNKENNEIIFTIAYLENEASTPFSSFLYYPRNFVNKFDENGVAFTNSDPLRIGDGFMFHEYKFQLFEAFDAQDTRRATTFFSFYADAAKTTGKGVALIKYLGFINTANSRVFSSDIPVYRYADVLLMYAEIENKKGNDPSTYINQIRQRAMGSAYVAGTHAYTHTDFASGELAILKERDKEFVAEGKRWWDIRRLQDASGNPLALSPSSNYGSTQPVVNPTEAYKLLWPLGTMVLNNDKLVKQTPGYTTRYTDRGVAW